MAKNPIATALTSAIAATTPYAKSFRSAIDHYRNAILSKQPQSRGEAGVS
jgi:hypothetical protein